MGIASLGGSVHLMTKEFMAQNNLDADKNVALVVTGDHNTSIQAMQNGHVDAAVISVPWQTVAEKAGLRKLAYFGDVMRLPMAGLGASTRISLRNRISCAGRYAQLSEASTSSEMQKTRKKSPASWSNGSRFGSNKRRKLMAK